MTSKRLAVLGSTGSIGVSTLDVVAAHPGRFDIVALAAGDNLERIERQIRRFEPECVSVRDAEVGAELRRRIGRACRIVHGLDGAVTVATWPGVDMLVSAIVGAVGLIPTHEALGIGRDVALANKESLVVAGAHMTRQAEENGAAILPVDSEHNALHQCLRGERLAEIRHLWLTASGGPFRGLTAQQLAQVDRAQALAHPTWKMGPKITIDSASLMNKGLEVIEARWLFGLPPDRIRVVVHPKSVVHSLVEFVDGSFKAQLGVTDMRHPIQYALSYPERWESTLPPFDPVAAGPLEFEHPDFERFPCLALAFRALDIGGAAPAVVNAANEVAVQAFLDERIAFVDIPRAVSAALERHAGARSDSLEELIAVDRAARRSTAEWIGQGVGSR
ncbi:MAG TPA: 1-deoxy-D-xylulose-5-phosphate reductoisomerase [Candidatus Polarisedimenticolaceae bacterium]|nr:1-deoxy-D-xylulose-5-phosphate reductoisomerase [Candidatus Polarisedimenticolaceae bacterium]